MSDLCRSLRRRAVALIDQHRFWKVMQGYDYYWRPLHPLYAKIPGRISVAWSALKGHSVAYRLDIRDGTLVLGERGTAHAHVRECAFTTAPRGGSAALWEDER